jgi:hypothetical protein
VRDVGLTGTTLLFAMSLFGDGESSFDYGKISFGMVELCDS